MWGSLMIAPIKYTYECIEVYIKTLIAFFYQPYEIVGGTSRTIPVAFGRGRIPPVPIRYDCRGTEEHFTDCFQRSLPTCDYEVLEIKCVGES